MAGELLWRMNFHKSPPEPPPAEPPKASGAHKLKRKVGQLTSKSEASVADLLRAKRTDSAGIERPSREMTAIVRQNAEGAPTTGGPFSALGGERFPFCRLTTSNQSALGPMLGLTCRVIEIVSKFNG